MKYQERQRLFRQHASARLRRDTAETTRIEAVIWPDLYLPHQLFVFALFTTAVHDHFGSDLDRARLAELMASLREARPGLHWLRAEALIRVSYDESRLYLDVPQSEQPGLMWAVLEQLIPTDTGEADLAGLFERADQFGREVVTDVFRAERLYGWADEDDEAHEEAESR